MNLFDLADPAKVAEEKQQEELQNRIENPAAWTRCHLCGRPIHPQLECNEADGTTVCLDCYMNRRKKQ